MHTLKNDSEPCSMNKLDQTLHSICDLESLGIINADKSVLEVFDRSMHFKEGRYEVSLPWKEYHATLPTNYELSLKDWKGYIVDSAKILQFSENTMQSYKIRSKRAEYIYGRLWIWGWPQSALFTTSRS